jgi:hypothetical protein
MHHGVGAWQDPVGCARFGCVTTDLG